MFINFNMRIWESCWYGRRTSLLRGNSTIFWAGRQHRPGELKNGKCFLKSPSSVFCYVTSTFYRMPCRRYYPSPCGILSTCKEAWADLEEDIKYRRWPKSWQYNRPVYVALTMGGPCTHVSFHRMCVFIKFVWTNTVGINFRAFGWSSRWSLSLETEKSWAQQGAINATLFFSYLHFECIYVCLGTVCVYFHVCVGVGMYGLK